MTKRGTPPTKHRQKGGHGFSSTAGFSTYMWSLALLQRPGRMYTFPRHTILHIFTITISEQPNAQRPVVQAYNHSPFRKAKRHDTPYVPVTYLSTASMFFIQEAPHNRRCISDGGRILLTAVVTAVVPKMLRVMLCAQFHVQ